MHTIFGLRTTVDMKFTVDPYGNICTFKGGKYEPLVFGQLPPDTKFSGDQEKMGWKSWPFVKGIPREAAVVKGMYYQDWMFGHIYEIDDEGNLIHNQELSPVNSKSFFLSECNVIPLAKEAIEPRELTSRPMSLADALVDLEKNEWAYKVSCSGNRLYAKGPYIVSYTGLKSVRGLTREVRQEGWEIVTSAPANVIAKMAILAEKEPKAPKATKTKEVKIVEKLNLEGETQPDKLLEAISNLAILSGKLIDSGERDAGVKLAEKLTYAIGHVSWKLRD